MALMQQKKPSVEQNPAADYVESEDATPEEQMQYEKALEMALIALHDEKTGPAIFDMVMRGGDLKVGVAKAVVTLLEKVSAELGGGLSDAAKVEVGEDLLNELLGLLIQGGKIKESEVDDQFVEDIVIKVYEETVNLKEMQGESDYNSVKEDLKDAQALGLAPEMPQGVNAMSNEHADAAKGLMRRGA